MLNSAEHEILNARKYKNIKKCSFFLAQISPECHFSSSYMKKKTTVVGILTFVSGQNTCMNIFITWACIFWDVKDVVIFLCDVKKIVRENTS